MDPLPFFIVDVFAEEKYAGNQLAVIRCRGRSQTGSDFALTTPQMQRIALEMHFSETTFITSETPRQGGYDVRIFTPGSEVPFAGHPTLGTAHILRSEVIQQPLEQIVLNLKIGQIPVRFGTQPGSPAWMRQVPPSFGVQLNHVSLAALLNLSPTDMDERFPVEEVSTGLPFIIAPLKTLAALQRVRVDVERLPVVLASAQAKEVLVFCPQTHQPGNHLAARMFAHELGVPEDPATGSANGCLAAYLVKNRYFGSTSIDIRVEQGYEISRPSLLYLKAEQKDDQIIVQVGGKSITVARGELV